MKKDTMSLTILPALHHIGFVVYDAHEGAQVFEPTWGLKAGPAVDLEFPNAAVDGVLAPFAARDVFVA